MVNALYTENYKILMTKNEEDTTERYFLLMN